MPSWANVWGWRRGSKCVLHEPDEEQDEAVDPDPAHSYALLMCNRKIKKGKAGCVPFKGSKERIEVWDESHDAGKSQL